MKRSFNLKTVEVDETGPPKKKRKILSSSMACEEVKQPEYLSLHNCLSPIASKWEPLGGAFGLNGIALTIIRANSMDVEVRLKQVLDEVYKTQPKLTWENVIEVLKQPVISENALAYQLEEQLTTLRVEKLEDYVRLLMLQQEGKLQQGTAMLESYFPDMYAPINQEGRSLLTMAAQCGHKGLLEFLFDHGADAFHTDQGGENVLGISAAQEDINIWLKTVLENKLITSAKNGDSSTVRRALEFGIHPDARERDEFGWTALLWACENGHQEIVDYLLQHGATPDIEDKSSWTGLMLATRNGYFKIVRSMLDRGADPNKITSLCWTPLMWTAEGNYPEIAKLLLEKGADPNIHDKAGLSPLFQAAYEGHFEVVKALVENSEKLDINHTTKLDWSALAVAVKYGHEDIVRYLVEHGADLSYVNKDRITVLHVACYKGHFEIASFLCKKKRMNVNVQDMDGLTPLMFAASQGQLNLVKLLVQDGRADLNLTESTNSWNALFFAMQAEHQEGMEYLLDTKRIDMTHKDVRGDTIFDLAEKLNMKAFEYLEKNFKSEMDKVEKRRIEAGESKPILKVVKETGEMYFADMIHKIQTKYSSPVKAGAAGAA